jgi:PhoH-like ATPase
VLDVSVLVHDSDALLSFGDNVVVIPISVVDQLDSFKRSIDGDGLNSRKALQMLDKIFTNGNDPRKGADLSNGGKVFIDDNKGDIITVVRKWEERGKGEAILVTKSPRLRLNAKINDISAEDYKNDKMISSIDEMYTGGKIIKLESSVGQIFAEKIYRDGIFGTKELEEFISSKELFLNQCCTFLYDNLSNIKTVLALYKGDHFKLVAKSTKEGEQKKILPLNKEQSFAYALLKDSNVSVVTLVGDGGTGKTLLALAAGYEQLGKGFKRIEVYRPNFELGQELGFLPGTVEKKFAPWMKPIFDNLELIMNGDANGKKQGTDKPGKKDSSPIAMMLGNGLISIEPINYLQGRTIHDTFIIFDEMQNFTPSQTKIIEARAGEGSKIVLTGDVKQRANPYVDEISNGLVYTVERFKGQACFGHVLLKDASVRSPIAKLVAELM